MAYTTRVVQVFDCWTYIDTGVALFQFGDVMCFYINDGSTPAVDAIGLTMQPGEKFILNDPAATGWAKYLLEGTNVESVVVVKA